MNLYDLVGYFARKFLGLVNPIGYLGFGGHLAYEFFLRVHFHHFFKQVLGNPFGEFYNSIHTRFFKQIGILAANTFNPEQGQKGSPIRG